MAVKFNMPEEPEHWYARYLGSAHWFEVRAAALQAAGYRCQVCNSSLMVQVHHRTYERLGEESPGDLTALCDACHSTFHASVGGAARTNDLVKISIPATLFHTVKLSDDADGTARVRAVFLVDSPTFDPDICETGDAVIEYRAACHPNGTPWGGSGYRGAIEALLQRPLRRRERVELADLIGRPCLLCTSYLSNREDSARKWTIAPVAR